MGRITFISVRIELHTTGYVVNVSVFGTEGVMLREAYDRLSWREALDVQHSVADHYRPGLQLMEGGIQHPLF